ncbi:MAG: UbiA family prenyltransferase [Candidatus Krumholzibacteriota bacterium]|nr:UbiA family prenyltransferase [Candidatus Krumholzibacteriota bacterium]
MSLTTEKKSLPPDYIFLLRPIILIPVWTFFLLGAYHGADIAGKSTGNHLLLYGILSFTALLGAVYIINQITDKETDLANNKLFLIPRGIIKVKAAWTETFILILVSFITAALLLPGRFIIILILSLMLGLAYSIEPLRFKRRPVLDIASNALGSGILNTLAGWMVVSGRIEGWEILLPYPLAVASVHLITTIADTEGDRKSKLKTSGVILEQRAGVIISLILMALSVAAAIIVENKTAMYASLFSLPFFLFPLFSKIKALSEKRILLPAKISTLIFSIAAGVIFKLYIPYLAAVLLITRVYYKLRFQISYPALK